MLVSHRKGVDALNNILLIGMTNRVDLIDEALLRPGRLEVLQLLVCLSKHVGLKEKCSHICGCVWMILLENSDEIQSVVVKTWLVTLCVIVRPLLSHAVLCHTCAGRGC
eukprot:6133494-Amphidinium_carterae.1